MILISIPVIGPGEATAFMAASLGHRFSIITITDVTNALGRIHSVLNSQSTGCKVHYAGYHHVICLSTLCGAECVGDVAPVDSANTVGSRVVNPALNVAGQVVQNKQSIDSIDDASGGK